ncbi:MAG: hypothetical protein JNK25_13320 [Phycisphaerae bacterium]|nr:hypothetical protein [Phycisphaerae bacterium]
MPGSDQVLIPAGRSWAGLSSTEAIRHSVHLSGAIAGNLTGLIEAGSIGRLQLPTHGEFGRILAPITVMGAFDEVRPSVEFVVCRELAVGTRIESMHGGLGTLVFGGDDPGSVQGSLLAVNGSIKQLRVTGPISIPPAGLIYAGSGIELISAHSIDAQIRTIDEDSQGGPLHALHVHPGPIDGSLRTESVGIESDPFTGIVCGGEIRGLIQIARNLNASIHAGAFGPDSHILIGGDMLAPISSRGRLARLTVGGNVGPAGFPAPGSEFGISITAPGGIGHLHVAGSMIEGPDQVIPLVYAPRIDEFFISGDCISALQGIPPITDCELVNARIGGDLVPRGWWISRFKTLDVGGSVWIDVPRVGLVFDTVPKDSLFRVGRSLVGDGHVRREMGLSGQIVANARNTEGVWTGHWSIGTSPREVTLTPVPHYGAHADSFGGGAVGEVPYLLHSEETSNSNVCARGFIDGWTEVRLSFRGPIGIGSGSPIMLFRLAASGRAEPVQEGSYSANISPSNPRHLLIRAVPGSEFVSGGLYRIQPIVHGSDRIRCEGTMLAEPPSVDGFVYQFRLVGDCGSAECGTPSSCECSGHCASADFNADGGIDGADVEAFFLAWEFGDADVNLDGGTDGADVEMFFCWWQSGGC